MTATATATAAQLLTVGSIAEDLGITVKPAGPFDVAVYRDGVKVRTSPRHDTDELTLGWAIVGYLRKAGRWQDWAFVMTVLRPGTTREEWLVVAADLDSE